MKKKLGIMILAAVLMVAVCTAASASLYYVTGTSVRVRSGPGTDYDIVSHLSRGTKIDVLSTSHGWARMTLWTGSDEAYISTKYISRTKPSSNPTPARPTAAPAEQAVYKNFVTANYYAIVNSANNYVNMRWEATKASQVRKVYYYGAKLKVIAENAYWCQVMDEATGEVGFMLKSLLLRVDDNTAAAGTGTNG